MSRSIGAKRRQETTNSIWYFGYHNSVPEVVGFATFSVRTIKAREHYLAYPISRWIKTRQKPYHPSIVNLRCLRCACGTLVLLIPTDIPVLIAAIQILVLLKKAFLD